MRKFILFIITISALSGFFNSNAQSDKDSLLLSELLNSSLNLCYSKPDSAILGIEKAISTSKRLNSTYFISKSFNVKGIYFDIINEWDSAIYYYQKTVSLSDSLDVPVVKASALNNLGLVYWNKDEDDKALEFYIQSLKIFENLNKLKGVANTMNNIGLILTESNQLEDALEYQKKALKIRKKINDTYGVGASLSNIGMIFDDMSMPDSALYYYRKSLTIKIQNKDDRGVAFAYNNIAGLFQFNFNKSDSAIFYLNQAIAIHKKLNNLRSLASSIIAKGNVYRETKKFNKAERLFKEAEEIGGILKDENTLLLVYKELAKTYKSQQKYNLSSYYFEKLLSLRDTIYIKEMEVAVLDITTKYETEKKEKENALLKHKTNVQQLKLNAASNRTVFLIIACILLIISAVATIYSLKNRQKRKLTEVQLNKEQDQIKAVIDAEEKERIRIAKDLHDGLGQVLSTAKLNISSLEENIIEDDKFLFDNSISLIDSAVAEVRNISHNMMPVALINYGLLAAIKELVKKINDTKTISVVFKHDEKISLSKSKEISLYRVVQEALNNMIKHSNASEINISLFQKDKLYLTITDNGDGFDSQKIKSSNGLGWKSMFSRISMLSGKINIESILNKGTTINIRLPL